MARKRKIEPAKEITIVEDATVKVKNELVNGKYTLSLLEMKMVMALAAHIDKNANDFEPCSIGARDLGDYMGLSDDKCYQSIKATAKKLLNRSLFFEWYKSSESKKKSWLGSSWFDYVFYDDEESTVEFKFATMIKPMLLQIREAYAQLECKPLMAFRSMYSNRFLMYVVEWERIQPHTVKIADLRDMLQLDKKYKQFSEFRTYVIEPALREINALTDYNVTAEPQKRGRSYDSYTFFIGRKAKAAAVKTVDVDATPAEWNGEQKAMYDELVGYGLTRKAAKYIASTLVLEDVRINIDYAKAQKQAGKITKDFASYLYAAIKEDYGGAIHRAAAQEAAAAAAKEAERIAAMTPEQLKARNKKLNDYEQARNMAKMPIADDKPKTFDDYTAEEKTKQLDSAAALFAALKKRQSHDHD